jgi:hypothetical protein
MKWRIRDLVDKALEVSAEVKPGEIRGTVQAVVSDEDKKVTNGQTVVVKINPITIPPNHLILISGYARHPLGNLVSVIEDRPKTLEKTRRITKAAFNAWEAGNIEKGEVIGVVDLMLTKLVT